MRKPRPAPATPATKASAEPPEPPGGRAMERARQFALQRGLSAPGQDGKPPQPAPAAKRPARKKP